MGQLEDGKRDTPWWYRVPPLAASTIGYAIAGILLYLNGLSAVASLALGAVAGLAAPFVQGFAQAAYDKRHR